MAAFVLVRKDSYHDSVLLMRISEALKHLAGVEDAVVAMGTPQNRDLLEAQGYGGPELGAAGPNDLLIAVKGEAGAAKTVEASLDELLRSERRDVADEVLPATLAAAVKAHPDANLVLISVPGEHAAREARRALALGMHVMIFSDNVAVEDEVALKREAVSRGLLLMGPDCGTAMINGKPLGFANAVRRGPIGVVGAAGTGLQEVTSCIHRLGGGVSQAIGTGGRDLSEAVGGVMTIFADRGARGGPRDAGHRGRLQDPLPRGREEGACRAWPNAEAVRRPLRRGPATGGRRSARHRVRRLARRGGRAGLPPRRGAGVHGRVPSHRTRRWSPVSPAGCGRG